MLYKKTPIGRIQVRPHIEAQLAKLSDEELLIQAIKEHKHFCISPDTYAMIEHRMLGHILQQAINPNMGVNKLTIDLTKNW